MSVSRRLTRNQSVVLAVLGVVTFSLTTPLAALVHWGIALHLAVRMGIAAVVLLAIIRTFPTKEDLKDPHELRCIFFCSVVSPLFVISAVLGSPSAAIVLLATGSVWAALLNRIVYGVHVTTGFWVRQLLAFGGLLTYSREALPKLGAAPLAIGVLAGAAFGVFSVLHKRRPEGKRDTDVLAGVLLSALAFGLVVPANGIGGSLTDSGSWVAVIFSGLLVGFGYAVIVKSLEALEPQTANMIYSAEAPLGMVWMALIFGTIPTSQEQLGAAILLSAVFWEAWASRDAPPEHAVVLNAEGR
ncbi:MAG: DMT family transporter [Deltaproteobacteria bacterium]|nr:DMT family transporter [Deltaproteobacteria bacterium]